MTLRGWLTRAALGSWVAAQLGLAAPDPAAAATSMFRGNPAHTGEMSSAAPRRMTRVKWQFPTGGRVVSSPVWHAGLVIVGSDDGNVYAIDAASGRQRWMHRTGGPVSSTPALADGRVYATSYDGRLHALDAATGELLWTYATRGERRFEARGLHGMQPRTQTFADPFDVYASSPVVAEGLVCFGSGDGHVYAVDASTGALRWSVRTGDVVHASPAYADGVFVVGSWDGRLYAIEARDGRLRWTFQGGLDPLLANQQGFQSSPAIVGGVVYTGSRDAHVYAIDLASGVERWRFSTGVSWVVGSPAVADGRVHFATSDSSLYHVVDAGSGKPLLQQQGKAYMFASPVLAGDVVLLGVLNGTLEARDRTTGELLWTFRTEASRENPGWALTADGRINGPMLFGSAWGDALAISAARQFAVGSIFSTPLVVDGVVYVGSADGRVYAIE